jgi:putative sterol carrier protein
MADATTRFFDTLGQLEHQPTLGRTTGSLRIDLDRDGQVEHWRVELRRGAVTVSRAAGPADCVVRTTAVVFEDLARGRANAMAATLRGQLLLDGNPALLVRFQRLFPAPTGRKMTSSARSVGRRRS